MVVGGDDDVDDNGYGDQDNDGSGDGNGDDDLCVSFHYSVGLF